MTNLVFVRKKLSVWNVQRMSLFDIFYLQYNYCIILYNY